MTRRRIAYVSPLNPRASGVSDYSEELLPSLGELVDVELFVDGYVPTNPDIHARFAVRDLAELDRLDAEGRYDLIVYQMGNNLHHARIYQTLIRHPGVVVLHDVVLHHLFVDLADRFKDPSPYLRELAFGGRVDGLAVGRAVLRGERPPPFFEYPLIERTVRASLGVVVHSEYARRQVSEAGPRRIAVVPAHVQAPPKLSSSNRLAGRSELGLPADAVVVGAFGYATPAKRLDVALRAFARLRQVAPIARFLIVGEVSPTGWLDPLLAELGPGDAVRLTGPVDFDRFERYIQATDLCVNLRYPTAGETSASLLRIMAAGVPAIVSDVGSFSELPDECCRKIPVDATEEDRLYRVLADLASDGEARRQIGDAARRHVLAAHSPAASARGYLDFVERVLREARW